MDEYTITLTDAELSMLIEAANIMHFRYLRPEMTKEAKKFAQEYAILCGKLYYCTIDQERSH